MLHSIDPGILFLQQEDVIKAGVLDVKQVISAVETTYAMLGRGELNTPSKINMSLPSVENWQSFFNSMPAYIGGDVNVAGFKWAAESKKNAQTPGIPYGIDITILSDPETVLPFCILDGTLITAMRTAAVGALHAKFVAPSFAETATLIGAGVIGRVMVATVHETLLKIKTIYLCDTNLAKAEAVAAEYGDSLGVKIIPTTDSKAAALKSQLIVCETPCRTPILDKSFLTPGCGAVSMMCAEIADDLGVDLKIVDMDFNALVVSLAQGDFDIVASTMRPTEKRRESVDFSNAWHQNQNVLVVRKGEESNYATPEDLAGHKVAAQTGKVDAVLLESLVA